MTAGTETWPKHLERIELINRARTFEVWDCWDSRRIARVIVKAVRPDRDREDAGPRLATEGELLMELEHPHIVRCYEVTGLQLTHVVMETLGGATLARLIDDSGSLDREETAHLGLQMVSALGYLHRLGIAHLDLKTSNVIAEAGRAKLIDLGLAAPFGRGKPGVGTWSYMAPEQVKGEELTAATDVWGLGAVLFECRCGHPPFDDPEIEGPSAASTDASGEWAGHYPQMSRPAQLTGDRTGTDPELDRLILDCLSPGPEDRPTLGDVATVLEDLIDLPPERRRYSKSFG